MIRDWRAGLAEAIKVALIQRSEAFYNGIEEKCEQ